MWKLLLLTGFDQMFLPRCLLKWAATRTAEIQTLVPAFHPSENTFHILEHGAMPYEQTPVHVEKRVLNLREMWSDYELFISGNDGQGI